MDDRRAQLQEETHLAEHEALEKARDDWANLRVKLQVALDIDLSTRPLPTVEQMLDTLIAKIKEDQK